MNTVCSKHFDTLAKVYFIVLLICIAPFAADSATAANALQVRSPLKFQIKTTDPATGKRKTNYAVGETVSVVFTLANNGRDPLKIKELQDTEISVKIAWTPFRSDKIDIREGIRGGTVGSYRDADGTVFWTSRDARYTTIAPGQTLEVDIADLRRFNAGRLADGKYTLTAEYENGQQASCSFKVVLDKARSAPILEKMVKDSSDDNGKWASLYLGKIRQPAISGRIATADGKGVREVSISITGDLKSSIETGFNGFYDIIYLNSGATYTLTPSLEGYIFIPASRTITKLNSKLANINFTAKRIPASSGKPGENENPAVGEFFTCGDPFASGSVVGDSQSKRINQESLSFISASRFRFCQPVM